jgi:D-psicose/D-tagatose/L-ribulose 3-epimerase
VRFGICASPSSFTPNPGETPTEALRRMLQLIREAGADYIEFTVGSVFPEGSVADFEALRAALEGAALRPEAFNTFIPKHHPITGPAVNMSALLKYCQTALQRCRALGGEIVVLGSGAARRIPDGFDRAAAQAQFVKFCQELDPIAEQAGVTIALEPLNTKEDNLLTSVKAGAALMDTVARKRIRLLADLYHMSEEKEPLSNVADAGARLVHSHLADLGRVAPGFAANGEEDFRGFFRNLKQANYDQRCSFEGRFESIEKQTKPLLDLLKKRWSENGQ